MRIAFASAEAFPFAKVGGLADVGGALPKALARHGHEVRLLLPGYRWLPPGDAVLDVDVEHRGRLERIAVVSHGRHEGVDVCSLHHEQHFARENIYGYDDDDARFTLFSKAVTAVAAAPRWRPDVLHVHDWHLGLVPQAVREGPHRETLRRTATVLTIHNLAYQGPAEPDPALLGGVNGPGNLLERGITHADAVTTVSRRYLSEILTPRYGMGLDGVLRRRGGALSGIMNGVDYDVFDPSCDLHIAEPYDAERVEGKAINKAVLRERSGLARAPDVPLIGMVARLVDQKGLGLVCETASALVELGAQLVVMGLGEARYERALEHAAATHPGLVAYHADGGDAAARLVYAGADLFLAPSTFEPCGLGPLIAMRYGAVPVVRRTGGLADNIPDVRRDPDAGLGFTFVLRYPRQLVHAVSAALALYADPPAWRRLQRRVMEADHSWNRSVLEYERVYEQALARRGTVAIAAAAR